MKPKRTHLYTLAAVAAFAVFLGVADATFDAFALRVLDLCGIYVVLALSLNLVNGFTGLFSLGHAGFMAVGAYTSALLTMTAEQKEMNFFLEPIAPWLAHLSIPFIPALVVAGLVAAGLGFVIAAPALRLRDDYLAIATLGFAEIIRVVLTNAQPITNGALGLKGLPKFAGTWEVWGCAALSVLFMILLTRSAYGRALKAVRDDEIAAGAMGVNVFRTKVVSFTVSSFMAGVGGALLGHLLTTIDPKMFTFMLTFNILLVVVLGGMASITGSVIASIAVTILMEALRFLDGPLDLGVFQLDARPGLRMVVFSALLMAVVIFRQRGLMGSREFSWAMLSRARLPWRRSGPAGTDGGTHGVA
ncbi:MULTISPECIES: branched-chain amino acid ABC transporter permease [Anaeromyxobacter]|uniref:branched-chain amino acid ABC transporter permease n=1 Tax=Anaeromyxobacter TaxID=161492 RepID=UPI001F586A86|nr:MULTISPECIES: branched-chain amino acid ABC transporter permease [unclassified Anaeromyxobacter]